MSVLIEAVTLVVRRRRFDSMFPGGADAFFSATSATLPAPRYAASEDPYLLALSFEHADHSGHAISLLRSAGLKSVNDTLSDLADFVLVDATSGPTTRVAWLGFNTHADGFSFAWDVPEPIGAVAGPAEWNREHRDTANHQVLGDESDQRMLLASENGVRTYLNLRTGALMKSDAPNVTPPVRPDDPNVDGRFGIHYSAPSADFTPRGRLRERLEMALAELGWSVTNSGSEYSVIQCKGGMIVYSCYYYVSEDSNAISCSVFSPLEINFKQRRRILEFVSRINCRWSIGGFDLNLDNGALAFRTSILLGDQEPSTEVIASIAYHGVAMMDRHLPRAMEVIAGLRSPVDAATAPLD